MVFISQLRLNHPGNLEDVDIIFDKSRLNVILGKNDSGKTQILTSMLLPLFGLKALKYNSNEGYLKPLQVFLKLGSRGDFESITSSVSFRTNESPRVQTIHETTNPKRKLFQRLEELMVDIDAPEILYSNQKNFKKIINNISLEDLKLIPKEIQEKNNSIIKFLEEIIDSKTTSSQSLKLIFNIFYEYVIRIKHNFRAPLIIDWNLGIFDNNGKKFIYELLISLAKINQVIITENDAEIYSKFPDINVYSIKMTKKQNVHNNTVYFISNFVNQLKEFKDKQNQTIKIRKEIEEDIMRKYVIKKDDISVLEDIRATQRQQFKLQHKQFELQKEHIGVSLNTNKEVKDIKFMLKNLNSSISKYREEVLEQIEKNQINLEQAIESVSLKINDLVKEFTQEVSHEEYLSIETELRQEKFGQINWDYLDTESKQLLITSELVYKFLNMYGDSVDYSGATVPLTKALENELHRYFKGKIIIFCDERSLPIPNVLLGDKHFTMGSVSYFFKKPDYIAKTVDYFRTNYANIPDLDCSRPRISITDIDNPRKTHELPNQFCANLQRIKMYRDKVAHKDSIKRETSDECREFALLTERFFIKFINDIIK
ncbi:hypothetical protein [Gottfriedia acidiceleris]|uniref:hypothetical protein n=1 Tax=Gottfriedia acidiceleris TaxID=371036 RepID=UPI002FFDD628